MNKKTIIGIVIFVVLIGIIIGIKFLGDKENGIVGLVDVYVATGGGKEDFLADPGVQKILKNKYHINAVFDTWSNGKTVTKP